MDVYGAPQIMELYPIIQRAERRRARWQRARVWLLYAAMAFSFFAVAYVWPL